MDRIYDRERGRKRYEDDEVVGRMKKKGKEREKKNTREQ